MDEHKLERQIDSNQRCPIQQLHTEEVKPEINCGKTSTVSVASRNSVDKKLAVLCCRGLRPTSSVVDRDLWQWYCEARSKQQGSKVSKSMIQARAKWAFHQAGITNFKASDGWYRRWIKRWQRFGFNEGLEVCHPLEEPPQSSSDIKTHMNGDLVTSENNNERNISESAVDKIIERNGETVPRDEAVELLKDKNYVKQTGKTEHDKTKYSEPLCSRIHTKHTQVLDITSGGESTDEGSGGACQKSGFIEQNEINASNVEPHIDSDSTAVLSTPMLNIVDYLPPEVMHTLHGNLPNSSVNGSTNSDSMDNVFPTSDMDASMDCLYYPPPCELSLHNNILSDHVHETVSNASDCSFELNHTDSYSCGPPPTAEAERLKDTVGFIPSWNNSSPSLLHNLALSNIHDNENIILGCSSVDGEDFVNSIFKDVSLTVSGQEENECKGSTQSSQLDVLELAVSHDALAPEVILEPCTSNSGHNAGPGSRSVAVETNTKKSKKLEVHQRKKGERYLPQFKVKVLAYAASHTLKETAKKFKVNDGTISSWKKEKDWKKQLVQNSHSSHGQGDDRKKMQVPPACAVDQQFLMWLRRCREQGRELTAVELKNKARQMADHDTVENCHWFKLWVSRFDDVQVYEEGLEKVKQKERHIQYPLAFKVEVAVFAEHHSQILAARTFNVSRKRVFEWLQLFRRRFAKGEPKVADGFSQMVDLEVEGQKKAGSKRSEIDVEVDMDLWTWYQNQQTKGRKPSWHEVQAKGLELYRGRGNKGIKCSYRWYKRWCDRFHVVLRHEGDDAMLEWALMQLELGHSLSHNDLQVHALSLASDNTFKASPGWAIRFCKRHPELLQHTPTLETALPAPLLQKVQKFRCEVQQFICDRGLVLGCVGNMDELYLSFSALASGSSTTAKRQLLVRRSEMENCHATIVLACLADGNILPPAVILKVGGPEAETEPSDDSVVVLKQEEGLMDTTCMCQWLHQIWFRHVRTPNLLLCDCHEPHVGESIKAEFSGHDSDRLIIPGGCTSKLQPLDVSLKSMFHASIQKQWSVFNSHSNGLWDTNGNQLQLPGRKEIVEWVTIAYRNLQAAEQETVRRSFLVTGLTVAANGSEDHFIENLSVIPKANKSA